MNLDSVTQILRLNSQKQRPKPFEATKIPTDPEEIDFSQTGLSFGIIHPVPNTLQDRGKGRDADTSADENRNFKFENIFRGGTEGTVDEDAGQDTTEGRIDAIFVYGFNDGSVYTTFVGKVAAQDGRDFSGEVARYSHVDGDVVFLGGTGEGERMILPDGDLGTAEEDILAWFGDCVLFLNLDLADVARMLDNL